MNAGRKNIDLEKFQIIIIMANLNNLKEEYESLFEREVNKENLKDKDFDLKKK